MGFISAHPFWAAIIAIALCFALIGFLSWLADGSNPATMASEGVCPDLAAYGNGNYYYLVDNRTGVVYLEYSFGHQRGLSVMLNPDGSPVTMDQLGLSPMN